MNIATGPERSSLKAFALNKETLRTFTQTARGTRRYDNASQVTSGSTCTSGECCCCAALED
jgi:hypothetical protein